MIQIVLPARYTETMVCNAQPETSETAAALSIMQETGITTDKTVQILRPFIHLTVYCRGHNP